jgi:hypothetical protein
MRNLINNNSQGSIMAKKFMLGWFTIISLFVLGAVGLFYAWKQKAVMQSYLVNIFAGIATILIYAIIEKYTNLKESEKTWKRKAAMYAAVVFVVGAIATLMVLAIK